jgi:hypothetical protein
VWQGPFSERSGGVDGESSTMAELRIDWLPGFKSEATRHQADPSEKSPCVQ